MEQMVSLSMPKKYSSFLYQSGQFALFIANKSGSQIYTDKFPKCIINNGALQTTIKNFVSVFLLLWWIQWLKSTWGGRFVLFYVL